MRVVEMGYVYFNRHEVMTLQASLHWVNMFLENPLIDRAVSPRATSPRESQKEAILHAGSISYGPSEHRVGQY